MKRTFRLEEEEDRVGYELVTGLVVPRPIAWIGTTDRRGRHNLAPYSFFNLVSADPPIVFFSGGNQGGEPKDSIANAVESGAFSVNVVTDATVEAMELTAASLPADTDEFTHAGLTVSLGDEVPAPLVSEAVANLECRVMQTTAIGPSTVVFGAVEVVHVDEGVLLEFGHRVDPRLLRAVGRMAGREYVRTGDVFTITRPT